MRIISGKHRGRKLRCPLGVGVRPTSDRLRQAIFNILIHGKFGMELNGINVLDAFAGTGALGLEALSRGAKLVTFIEKEISTLKILQHNVANFGETENSIFSLADASEPPFATTACDLAFLDPPYRSQLGAPSLLSMSRKGWFKRRAICTLEISRLEAFVPPFGFSVLDDRNHGSARIIILRWSDPQQLYLKQGLN